MGFKSWFVLLLALVVVVAILTPDADAYRGLADGYVGDLEPRGGGGGTDDGGDPDGVGLESPGEQFGPQLPTSRAEKGSSGAAAFGGVTLRTLHLVIVTAGQLVW